ncbi:DUF397 domain-containing protein [Streptodolium elevatio]
MLVAVVEFTQLLAASQDGGGVRRVPPYRPRVQAQKVFLCRRSTVEHPAGSVLFWRKSQASQTANCVEAACSTGVFVRDSKSAAHGPVLTFRGESWADFLGAQSAPSTAAGPSVG